MATFHSLALTPTGERYLKTTIVPAFEIRLGAKVLIALVPMAGAYYLWDYTPVAILLSLTGLTILLSTLYGFYRLIKQDDDARAYERKQRDTLPYVPVGDTLRTIAIRHSGVVEQMVIDPLDDELTKLILKLLDASIMLTFPDATTLPPYRSLNMAYADYDRSLRGLGTLVKRERGLSPTIVYPHTLQTIRTLVKEGDWLPFRNDAPFNQNRQK
jgi:hypothetical protein